MKELVLLIDGNSLMYRAYFATAYSGNLMKTTNGLYTNAIYGFVNLVNKIIDTYQPSHMLVAFDKGKKTFRHQLYEEYKATRSSMPSEMAIQIPLIKEYLDIMRIKRLELDEYEADDIIGSYAKKAKNDNYQIMILSGDKDLLQLVDEQIAVCLTKKGITELDIFTYDNFLEKMGHTPSQLIDYKALAGDSSDNIPGVKGIGPKTALNLITKYQSLNGIYQNINSISGKTNELLVNHQDAANKSYQLAKIYQDIEEIDEIDALQVVEPVMKSLRSFYEKLEFQSFIKRMTINSETTDNEYQYYYNDIEKLCLALSQNEEIALEIELDHDNYHHANLLGVGFLDDKCGYYISSEYLHDSNIKAFLSSPQLVKKVIDSKKVIVSLNKLGIAINNIKYDFMLAAYLLNPQYISNDVKNVFEHFDNVSVSYHEEVYGKKMPYGVDDIKKSGKYCLDKLAAMKQVESITIQKLVDDQLITLLDEVEIPLAMVLAQMEIKGFKIDQKRLGEIGETFENKIKMLTSDIHRLCGEVFNINSPKQLGVILFEKMNISKGKKNKTGYQTNVEILETLVNQHPVIPLILDYRKYTKLYNTYITGLFNVINQEDSKVHTIFKQYLTLTGRLSSVEPNIQNIPIKDEEGKLIRSAFVSSFDNGVIVSADYSQIELRVLACMANASQMIDDFNKGMDLHTSTAAKIYNKSYEEITSEERQSAKAINFGIIYGMSDWGLSESLHITPIEARSFIERYFAIYPQIKNYLDEVIARAYQDGYTKTFFGRRRYISELQSNNKALKNFGERIAMNAPIQGTAADIIKIAMIKLAKRMKDEKLESQLVAQVHDELIVDTAFHEIAIVQKLLQEEMEKAVKMKVIFKVDVEASINWHS